MQSADLDILRCPVSGARLAEIGPDGLEELNGRIRQGTLFSVGGERLRHQLKGALFCEDGHHAYIVDADIVVLLPHLGIHLDTQAPNRCTGLTAPKHDVRQFYENVGWEETEAGTFADADLFDDQRPVSTDYRHSCHLRVNRYIRSQGEYLLDVASGPVQHEEYLTYSEGYGKRVCVDFSRTALLKAKERLGDHGLYLLADVTNLPLADKSIDGAVSLHTVYHIPPTEQSNALEEIHRVLSPGSRAAIVYTWGRHTLLMRLFNGPVAVRLRVQTLRSRLSGSKQHQARSPSGDTDLYFAPQAPSWLLNTSWRFDYELTVWRLVSVGFLRTYVRDNWLGHALLKIVWRVEEAFPHWSGRYGIFPLIVIERTSP